MFTSTGILVAGAHGPIGDTVAFTRPSDGHILYRKRRRLKERRHKNYICEVFHDLDEFYHEAPQSLNDTWNAQATAPGISGYDSYMSQGLTATSQGFYVPDLPGEGDGSTPSPIMPGACQPPPPIAPVSPDAKCLVGQAIVNVRLDSYGYVEYRYQHSFRDPRFPNPADVTCVILGLWDSMRHRHHLRIIGEVGVNKDTGWVNTYALPEWLTFTAFGHYRYFLLDQQFDLPIGQAVGIPEQPDAEDGHQEALHAPFVDLHDGNPVPVGETDTIYGSVSWSILRYVQRLPYRWYHCGFTVRVTARPNYQPQVGSIHLRGFYDKINYKWRLNLRGKLRTIIRTHSGPMIWKPPWNFYKIVRVDNPSWLGLKINLTWKADSISKTIAKKREYKFDTFNSPAWERR